VSEVVISGNVAVTKAPAPSPTIKVDMPPPVAPDKTIPQDSGDIRLRHISDPIELSEGQGLREEIRRQKREADPIYEWKADALPEAGEHESFGKQIRRASESQAQARAAIADKDFRELPLPEQAEKAAKLYVQGPLPKVGAVTDDDRLLPALNERASVLSQLSPDDAIRNTRDATRLAGNYRQAELDARETIKAQLLQDHYQAEAKLQTPQPPQPAPQPAPQVEQEKLQAERAQLAMHQYWQQLSHEEQAAANEMVQIQQWASQSYTPGELQGQPVQGDERRAWLAEASRRYNTLQQGLQTTSTVRAAQQTQIAQAHQQQIDNWGKQQDELFTRQVAERHPHLAANPEKMRRAAKEYLIKTTGLTEAQITQQWRAGRWRSAPEQMILADAVSHQMARQSMSNLNAKREHLPPVRPGTYRPPGAGDFDRIADLKRQLGEARGDRAALEIAKKLTQAKRAAGEL
jgi:hypothetical protein